MKKCFLILNDFDFLLLNRNIGLFIFSQYLTIMTSILTENLDLFFVMNAEEDLIVDTLFNDDLQTEFVLLPN